MKLIVAIRRWIDALWGYDVFIAHRRVDAAAYARALYERLKKERISSFIDQVQYGAGDSLLVATRRHVAKSTVLILVGSPELLNVRRPVDWLEQEIDAYLSSHVDPKVLLIEFGGAITAALANPPHPDSHCHSLLKRLAPFLRLPEGVSGFLSDPSDRVLEAIRRQLDGRRRDRTRLLFFQGAALVLVFLLILSAALGVRSEQQRKSAESRRLVAEARASLASPPATQLALLQARAALLMANTLDSQNLSTEVIRRLAMPVGIFRGEPLSNGAPFAALLPDGKLVLDEFGGPAIASVHENGPLPPRTKISAMAHCEHTDYARHGTRALCRARNRIQVWDILAPRAVFDRTFGDLTPEAKIALDREGDYLAIADDRLVKVLDSRTGISRSMPLPSTGWPPLRLDVSTDGRYVAVSPSSIKINTATPAFMLDMRAASSRLVTQGRSGISAVTFSADGRKLGVAEESGRIQVFNVVKQPDSVQVQAVPGLTKLSFSDDGRFVAAGATGSFAVYSMATGMELARGSVPGPLYHIGFEDGGAKLITAGAGADESSTWIAVWSLLESSDFASVFVMPEHDVMTIGFDAHNRLLQLTTDGVRAVDLASGEATFHPIPGRFDVNTIETGTPPQEVLLLARDVFSPTQAVLDLKGNVIGQEFEASDIAATPDGRVIAFLRYAPRKEDGKQQMRSSDEAWLGVWSAATRSVRSLSVPESINSVSLDSAGKYVVVTFGARRGKPAALSVYAADTLAQLGSITALNRIVSAVAPDGGAVLSADGTQLSLRRLPDLEVVKSIQLFGMAQELTFSPSSDRFGVVDSSGTISVYAQAGDLLVTQNAFFKGSQRRGMAFSPDGRWLAVLASGMGAGILSLIPLRLSKLDAELCARLHGEPNATVWEALLPNDKPPRPCTLRTKSSGRT